MARIADLLLATAECDLVSWLELDYVLAQWADAQLRPRQVLQDRYRTPRAPGGVAHAAYRLLVLCQRAVGVVQPRHVHAGTHHREQRLRLARGWADGGDDLCAAHCLATVAVAAGARGARV